MARILISEPHRDVRSLLEIVVTRLGHEPVVHGDDDSAESSVDVAVIEPGEGAGYGLARRLHDAGVPMVFASIFPPAAETLDLEPSAYLVKPFALFALENALRAALRSAAVV